MKRAKGLLVFVLVFISTFLLSSTTSFAAGTIYTENVIPTMTSNTSPSGEASASSYFVDSNYNCFPWKAFDHITNTSKSLWATAVGTTTGWLAYEFPEAKCITKYTIVSRNPVVISIGELPKTWTFEALDEKSGTWVILDTQTNIIDWSVGVKKEFEIANSNTYKKYRINISANGGYSSYTAIGELEMMESVKAPTDLNALGGTENIKLTWNEVANAQSYVIKRSLTSGGTPDTTIPFTPIVSGSVLEYTDYNVTPGTTYYYVVTAIVSGTTSTNSNEASATPTAATNPDYLGNSATLIITMTNGGIKEYSLPIVDTDKFITWYDNKSEGTGKSYYTFTKLSNIVPYLRIKEYISFDKISSFEVKEFNQ